MYSLLPASQEKPARVERAPASSLAAHRRALKLLALVMLARSESLMSAAAAHAPLPALRPQETARMATLSTAWLTRAQQPHVLWASSVCPTTVEAATQSAGT